MDQTKVALAAAVALLGVFSVYQSIRISGLEGRLTAMEAQSLEAPGPRRGGRGPGPGFGAGMAGASGERPRDLFESFDRGPAGGAETVEVSRDQLAGMVQEETRRMETERRERGREMWLQNMAEEIETFAAEENLSPETAEQVQAYAEDYLLTITDLRRAIYDGDVDAAQGREDIKTFHTEHEERMVELLGDEGYRRLQGRIGRGGRGGR